MSTYGVLLPCDGSEPIPVSVGGLSDLQEKVGGYIDVVVAEFDPNTFGIDGPAFEAIGYVNDEGIILDLPLNGMASIMFQRQLFGPVVVVSATNPGGTSDGDHYDVPEWFMDAVFKGGLFELSSALRMTAFMQAEAVRLAYAEGLIGDEEWNSLVAMMESGNDEYLDDIEDTVGMCMAYAVGRAAGVIPKWNEELSDEEINEFWEQEKGGE